MKMQLIRKILGACGMVACVAAYADIWQDSYAFEAAGKYPEAIKALSAKFPTSEFAQMRTAYLQYMEGRFDESLSGYQRLINANPRSIEALLGATLPLLAQKKCGDVIAMSKRVISISAWQYTAYLRIMQCDESAGKWSAVAETAKQLSVIYPSDATTWVYLARGQAGTKHINGAKIAYERVLQIVPGHKEALAYLAANP